MKTLITEALRGEHAQFLAIFVGFGAHHFYLERYGRAVLGLSINVIGVGSLIGAFIMLLTRPWLASASGGEIMLWVVGAILTTAALMLHIVEWHLIKIGSINTDGKGNPLI